MRHYLVLALVTFIVHPAFGQTPRPLDVDDLFEIRRVGSPRISPDGQWVAYTVSQTSLEDEKSETRMWMVPFAGGDPLPMTTTGSSASNPSWSPDNRYLSFQASRAGGSSQVWVLDRRGGEAQQLTDVEHGVSGYEWSPDGARLLLSIRDPEEENDKEESDVQEPWVVDRLQFKRDGTGYLTGNRHTHLYVFDVLSKALTQITSGNYNESQGAWSPDGSQIAFVSNRTQEPDGNFNSDIWIVAAANTDKGQTLLQVTSNPGSDTSPVWSPDGQWIAYTTVVEPELIWYATRHLAIASVLGTERRLLTQDTDRNFSGPMFSDDGRWIYARVEDSAENHLTRVRVSDGNLDRPVSGPLAVRDQTFGPDGKLAVLVGHIDRPNEIFAVDNGDLRQLTFENDEWMSQRTLGDVRNVTFPSKDGTEIEGFVYLPPGYRGGLRYPTLLRIHGGPVAQFSHSFNFEAQLFAAQGYVVVTANPRGSSGYGQDFSHAIWADWGNKDFEDVMGGVDFAIEEGYADPNRLGVGGWSYGGILTNYVITKTDRFKGAITGASEVFYRANYGHDHYQRQWESELGLPWETPDAWDRISPFTYVENVTTPTLIMGGEDDWNVPIQNSEQLYQALRRRGVETQLVVYPGQSHGLRTPSYQKDRLERYLAWYAKYVKQVQAATSDAGLDHAFVNNKERHRASL